MYIDISQCKPEEVLVALYDAALPLGLGALQYKPEPLTLEAARKLVEEARRPWDDVASFDYVAGRPLKVHLTPAMRADLYDRDQGGDGTALRVLKAAGLDVRECVNMDAATRDLVKGRPVQRFTYRLEHFDGEVTEGEVVVGGQGA